MAARKLSLLEIGLLQQESEKTPMHVAGLLIFEEPTSSHGNYVLELVERFRSCHSFRPPWNYKLKNTGKFQIQAAVLETFDIDMEYHVRHLALPKPGGERELGQLISRLHSQRLDLGKPLWELHIIGGLEGNRFALYIKMHHCIVDGVSATKLIVDRLSELEDDPRQEVFWASKEKTLEKKHNAQQGERFDVPSVSESWKMMKEVGRVLSSGYSQCVSTRSAPMTVLNERIQGQRRFATHVACLGQLKEIAKNAGCSLNDVVLVLMGTVLREYLIAHNALPVESLTVSMPVSLHKPGEVEAKNNVTMVLATLGTNIADDRARLEAVINSTIRAKNQLLALPEALRSTFGNLLLLPHVVATMSGMAGRIKPSYNVVISNVPGPRKSLYLFGSKLINYYPVSIPTHGSAINITCLSYDQKLHFGLTACRDSLPKMQQMAVDLEFVIQRYRALYQAESRKEKVLEG